MARRHKLPFISRVVLALGLVLLWAAPLHSEEPPRLAVVVNNSVPVEQVEYQDLKRILLGDRRFWDPGQRITILIHKDETWEREQVLSNVLGMTYGRFKFHWLAKVNRDKALAAPLPVPSPQAALQMLQQIPGAVAFMDASAVPGHLKVLLIDGASPEDATYPL